MGSIHAGTACRSPWATADSVRGHSLGVGCCCNSRHDGFDRKRPGTLVRSYRTSDIRLTMDTCFLPIRLFPTSPTVIKQPSSHRLNRFKCDDICQKQAKDGNTVQQPKPKEPIKLQMYEKHKIIPLHPNQNNSGCNFVFVYLPAIKPSCLYGVVW